MTLHPVRARPDHTPDGRPENGPAIRTIAVLAPFVGGFYFGNLLSGAARAAAASNHVLLAVQTFPAGLDRGEDPESPPHEAQVAAARSTAIRLATRTASGLVVISTAVRSRDLGRLHRLGKPLVLVSGEASEWPVLVALPDNVGGVRAAVEHLIGHGHRRIGFVGTLAQSDLTERYEAYRQALGENGIEPDPAWLFLADDTLEAGGRSAGERLLAAGRPTTALIVATDRNAIGVTGALTGAGLSLPRDQAIIGFDNTEAGARSHPRLSSVEPHFERVGEQAVQLLSALRRGGPVRRGRYRTATSLVIRESCGCPGGPPATVGRRPAVLPAGLEALLAAAARKAEPPEPAALNRAAEAVFAAEPAPETLTELVAAVLADQPGAETAAAVVLALIRAQSQAQLVRAGQLETSITAQVQIGMDLMRPGRADPRRLDWLAPSRVTAACLGLWSDPEEGLPARLRVAGARDRDGALDPLIGVHCALGDFPPPAIRQRCSAERGEAVIVIPVTTERREWGLLAVVGSVEHRATSVRDDYNHWATLLAVALEQDELLRSQDRQRADLEQAYVRERELADSVRASEERYALVTRATDDGLWDWDVSAGVVYYSPRWKSMLGYGEDEIGGTPGEWLDRVHPDHRADLSAAIAAQLGGSRSQLELEHRVRTRDGGYRWVLCRALTVLDEAGCPARLVGAFIDLADRKALEQQLRHGALHDPLTQLPNRALFLDRLETARARARRRPADDAALMVIRVAGSARTAAGTPPPVAGRGSATDSLIGRLGRRLAVSLDELDGAGRLGTAELAVLLADDGQRDLTAAAGRIEAELRTELDPEPSTESHPEPIARLEYGLVIGVGRHESTDAALRAADIALHRAQVRGGRVNGGPAR